MKNFEEIESEIENFLELGHNNDGSIQAIASSRYIDYAASVILGRAIPDIYDGLKPVHRRILQTAKDLHIYPEGAPKKSARIVGHALGIYHPHGDTSVYDAMVGLAQPWNKIVPLIIGQGNFGSIDGDNPAAQRYTEAKLSKAGMLFFKDIDKKVVDLKDNYDSTEKEFVVLPVPYPNLLINGGSGIAAGIASYIPPHNPKEVLDALIYATKQKMAQRNISAEKILSIIVAPDFPTGGIVYKTENMLNIIKTGKGSIRLRAKHFIEQVTKTREAIVITEIPYQINKVKLIKEIVGTLKDKNDLVNIIRDESDKDGLRIYIELKPGVDSSIIWNLLIKHTSLDISVNYNMNVTKDGSPLETNIIEALESFVDFRKNIIQRKFSFIRNQAEQRLEIVNGLLIALEDIDNVISIVKKSKEEAIAIEALNKKYNLSDRQSKAILEIKIQKLLGLEKIKLISEKESLENTISDALSILESDEEQYKIIISESRDMKKEIGVERLSEVHDSVTIVSDENTVPDEPSEVYFSKNGYLRYTNLNKKGRGKIKLGIELQNDDFLIKKIQCSSNSLIFLFTKSGKVFARKSHELPDIYSGRFAANLFDMESDDRIVNIISIDQDLSEKIIFVTKKGFVKKSDIKDYSGAIRKSGIAGIKIEDEDELVFVDKIHSENILLASSSTKVIKFNIDSVSVTGRNSRGVIGMKLEDSFITGVSLSEKILFNIYENGFIKYMDTNEFKVQNRGGKGVYSTKVTKSSGEVVKTLFLNDFEGKFLLEGNETLEVEISNKKMPAINQKVNNAIVVEKMEEVIQNL